jgi:hypothetical protein
MTDKKHARFRSHIVMQENIPHPARPGAHISCPALRKWRDFALAARSPKTMAQALHNPRAHENSFFEAVTGQIAAAMRSKDKEQ